MDIEEVVKVAGIAATVIAGIFALVQWRNTLKEQKRHHRLESARLAWELANYIHAEPLAANALELLEGESSKVRTERHGTHCLTDVDIKSALSVDVHDSSEKAAAIRFTFDCMFFALDRLRSAMAMKLINHNDLSAPTIYYCNMLVSRQEFVLAYGRKYGYLKTVALIERLARLYPIAGSVHSKRRRGFRLRWPLIRQCRRRMFRDS